MIIIVGAIIGLSILALFVLLFTVRAKISLVYNDELILKVKILGFTLFEIPEKPRKYRLRDYTPKKIAKRGDGNKVTTWRGKLWNKSKQFTSKISEKLFGKSKLFKKKDKKKKKQKEEKKKTKLPPFSDMTELFFRIISLFFGKFFKRLHIKVAKIRIAVGSGDAATTALLYCAVCSALNPVLVVLDNHSNLHGMKKADICITPDYLREDIDFDVDLGFSICIMGLVGVLLRVLISLLVGWDKISPSKKTKGTQ